jgi:hypothetical protein
MAIAAVAAMEKASDPRLRRMLQSEPRRAGCNSGAIDGKWNAAAQK